MSAIVKQISKQVEPVEESHYLEIKCRTTAEERLRRFEEAQTKFLDKYFELVWFARSDETKLMEDERYEVLGRLKEIAEKYKEEVADLYSESSDWAHGFNSGILAYARYRPLTQKTIYGPQMKLDTSQKNQRSQFLKGRSMSRWMAEKTPNSYFPNWILNGLFTFIK